MADGATASFTLTPDAGYAIDTVTGCSGSLSGNTYTTGPVTADCSISASFATSGGGTTWTVTASAGAGGSITPASATVADGATASFTVTPDSGYAIDTVTGCSGSLSGNTYTTGPVTADCSVSASFRATVVAWNISANATALPGSAPPVVGGQVQGAGPYADGAAVTLVAVPAPGFAFVGWEEGGATVATTARYAFTASADRNLTARFALRHPFVDRILDRQATVNVATGDFDGDGHADDLIADRIWLNNGRAGYRLGANTTVYTFGSLLNLTNTPFDADGDGDDDFLRIAFQPELFLNDGTGRMQLVADAFGTTPPSTVGAPAVGDLDGDGDPDLVIATATGTADVWFNDGQGSFSPGQDLGALVGSENNSKQFALADLDGDGDRDLVFVGPVGGAGAGIWFNDGHGAFTAATQTPPSNALYVAAGDLDGDGDADLVFGLSTGTALWFNDGHGAFTAATSGVPAFQANGGVALGDVDGDGDLDLVLGNRGGAANNQVWLNDGHGAFSAGQTLEADYTFGVTLADLDRDGDLDIATANGCYGGTCPNNAPNPLNRIWLGDGRGNFREPVQTLADNNFFDAADIDGDGDLDLVSGSSVWRNDGHVFTRIQTLSPSTNASVTLGDLDGDGDPDLVTNSAGRGGYATVWFNANGVFTKDTSQTLTYTETSTPGTVRLFDMDGDGDLDLMVFTGAFDAGGNGTGMDLVLYKNGGSGRFSQHALLDYVAAGDAARDFTPADLDGDGDLDLVYTDGGTTSTIYMAINDGQGNMTVSTQYVFLGGNTMQTLAVADFDGDGDPDLAIGYTGITGGARLWLNDGTGSFADSGQGLGDGNVNSLAAADLDGDGDTDLVTTRSGDTAPWHAWLNDGSGTFSDAGEIRPPEPAGTPTAWQALLADFDADGAPDLAAFVDDATGSGTTSTIQIYRNAAAP